MSKDIYPKISRLHNRHENSFLLQEKKDGSNFLVVFDYESCEFVDCYTKKTIINENSDKFFIEAKEKVKSQGEDGKKIILILKHISINGNKIRFNAFCCEILGVSEFPYNKTNKGDIFVFDLGGFNKQDMKVSPYLFNLNINGYVDTYFSFIPSKIVNSLEEALNFINSFPNKDTIEGGVIKDKLLNVQYKYIYETKKGG